MSHLSLRIGIFAVICGLLANVAPALAASNQTWVSESGIDQAPCGILAPCQTFQFAYGQTSAGGVINVVSGGPINATVRDSVSAGNSNAGIYAVSTAMSPLNVMVDRTASINNAVFGIVANSAAIRIGDSTVSGNNTGLSITNGGTIASYSTNKVNGNFSGGDGAPSTTIAYK